MSSNGTLKLAIVTAQTNKMSGLIKRNDDLLSIIMAIEAINNKTDGFYDELLPNTTIAYEFYDSEEDTATVASHGGKFSASESMDECDRKNKAFKGFGITGGLAKCVAQYEENEAIKVNQKGGSLGVQR